MVNCLHLTKQLAPGKKVLSLFRMCARPKVVESSGQSGSIGGRVELAASHTGNLWAPVFCALLLGVCVFFL